MRKEKLRSGLSRLFLFCLLMTMTPLAFAETSIRDRKGTMPAEGTWIDRESYVDGSVYENPPTQVNVVRVGLRYGERAVEDAEFRNTSGGGFRIGVYDGDRNFIERLRTEEDYLRVTWAAHEENGLMILAGEEEGLLYLSRDEQTLAIEAIGGETEFRENTYCGGFECRKAEDYQLSVINYVDLETYVKGVVPYEMAQDWPMEALKAQAVCARTYMVYNQNAYEEYGFDLTDDTRSQVYRGTTWATSRTDAAADATRGELIRYQGEVCEIYYFAADGGATEDGSIVFETDKPYLCGKRDPFEQALYFAYRSWKRNYSGEEIADWMERRGHPFETVVDLKLQYSAMGNVIAVTFVGESGAELHLEGRACYSAMGLPDCRFTMFRDEDGFHFRGSGLGHSCGMSQWGARAMDEVYGYDYNDIIRFYFTGVYIA